MDTVSRKKEKNTARCFLNNNNNNNKTTIIIRITITNCIHLRDISKTRYNYTINQYKFTNQKEKGQKTSRQGADSLPIPQLPHPPSLMYQRQLLDRWPYMQK